MEVEVTIAAVSFTMVMGVADKSVIAVLVSLSLLGLSCRSCSDSPAREMHLCLPLLLQYPYMFTFKLTYTSSLVLNIIAAPTCSWRLVCGGRTAVRRPGGLRVGVGPRRIIAVKVP